MPTVIVGSATVDEQIGLDGVSKLQLGGVVAYAGAVFANAGLSPTAVSPLGGPWAGSARGLLARMGVRLCESDGEAMTSFRNRVLPDGEREQDLISTARPIDAELTVRALEGLERPHVHLGPLHAEDISGPALRIIAARAATVTLDVQGLLRASTPGRVREEVARLLPDALAMSRIVKAGQEELRALLGSGIRLRSSYGGQVGGRGSAFAKATADKSEIGEDREEQHLLREFGIDELVVTCGRAGGYVVSRSSEKTTFSAVPIERMRDTTGAGDVFFAQYVVARIYENATVREACERGAVLAARHVAGGFLEPGALSLVAEPLPRGQG